MDPGQDADVPRRGSTAGYKACFDEATGKWGLRVNRVEIKRAVDPPQTIKDAMEKQMRAERDKRAAILSAEGARRSQILTAEGDKQGAILRAEGQRTAAILGAEGQSRAIDEVFQAVHRNDPDPKLLAYQYLQMLPQLAQGQGSTFWVIPSEVTAALQGVSRAFTEALPPTQQSRDPAQPEGSARAVAGCRGRRRAGPGGSCGSRRRGARCAQVARPRRPPPVRAGPCRIGRAHDAATNTNRSCERRVTDRIVDVWGNRTPHEPDIEWPVRVDESSSMPVSR